MRDTPFLTQIDQSHFNAATVTTIINNAFLYYQKRNAGTIEISVFTHSPEQQKAAELGV